MVNFDRVIDFDGSVLEYEFNFDTKQVQKNILSLCGGVVNETYYRLLNTDIEDLAELIDVFNEYQRDIEKLIKEKNGK